MEPSKTKVINAVQWRITCLEEGHESFTYAVAHDGYGVLLGRTPSNEIALFDTWADPTFDEVKAIVEGLDSRARRTGYYQQKVLGVSCDRSPKGYDFEFAGRISCPVCGSANVRYGPDEPPDVLRIDIPLVTHEAWRRLDPDEKRRRIRGALEALARG